MNNLMTKEAGVFREEALDHYFRQGLEVEPARPAYARWVHPLFWVLLALFLIGLTATWLIRVPEPVLLTLWPRSRSVLGGQSHE